MFCPECGHELQAGATACSCGAPIAAAPRAPSSQVGEKVKIRSKDALHAVKIVALNPVAGLPETFQSLEKRQAMEVGIVFAVAFEICVVIGLYLMLPRWAGSPGFGEVLKIVIVGCVPFLAIAGANAVARKVSRGQAGTLESDVFIAGVSVLPFGVASLLAGILGVRNLEVSAIVAVFALSYTILILYTGCTRISGISEARAVPAVPIIILIAGWLSKILFAAML